MSRYIDLDKFEEKLMEYADMVRKDDHVGAEKYNRIVFNTIMTVDRMLDEQPVVEMEGET